MSVDLICVLIDKEAIAREAARVSALQVPNAGREYIDEGLQDALPWDDISPDQRLYEFAEFESDRNTRACFEIDIARCKLIQATVENGSSEEKISADALYQFLSAFLTVPGMAVPCNEYEFTRSVIIGEANCRRLHFIFKQINFDALRSLYKEDEMLFCGHKFNRIKSFQEFVDYAAAFDTLLLQAIEKQRFLYIYAC